jgi:hypothetical protein
MRIMRALPHGCAATVRGGSGEAPISFVLHQCKEEGVSQDGINQISKSNSSVQKCQCTLSEEEEEEEEEEDLKMRWLGVFASVFVLAALCDGKPAESILNGERASQANRGRKLRL